MSPILGAQGGLSARSFGIFGGVEVFGDFESIQTQTVSTGGTSAVTFSSISSAYKHLQIRGIAKTNRATLPLDELNIRVGNGSLDTGNNYSDHSMYSDITGGTTVSAGNDSAVNRMINVVAATTTVVTPFSAFIVDFFDYANTSKYKTMRALSGSDTNGAVAGYTTPIKLASGEWYSTSAINTISFYPSAGTLITEFSSFALYGIKG